MSFRRPILLRLFLHLILAAVGIGCSDFPFETAQGGSGTETTGGSKVVGRVVYPDGSAADGATLTLRSSGYLQDTSEAKDTAFRVQSFASSGGAFSLDSVGPGDYVLEIRDRKGNASVRDVRRPADGKPMDLATLTLHRTGSLRGRLGRIAGAVDRGWIQVYGLPKAVRADAEGGFLLADMPAGTVRLRALSSRPHWGYPDSLAALIAPADSLRLPDLVPRTDPEEDYRTWPHSRLVLLNLAGLPLSEDVVDFPLLLRLDTGNFDFKQSTAAGLRFSDAAGTHLSYAVDAWDSANGLASVWVHLDRVRAGSGGLAFTMHWGKPAVPDRSEPAAVFSSFAGVWHLSDPIAGDGSGRFEDASPTEGQGEGRVEPGRGEGAIGTGRSFQGSHGIQAPGAEVLRPYQAVTLSAWVRVTGNGLFGGDIASMGDNYALRVDSDGDIWFFLSTDSTVGKEEWRICSSEGLDLRDSLWHHVAGTYDGSTLRVMVDGVEKGSRPLSERLAYGAGRNFWMGRHGNGSPDYGFYGDLDEVQDSPMARSADWIRLSHATQRPGSFLVEHKR